MDQAACVQHHDEQRHGCKWRDWMAHGMLEIVDKEKLYEVGACTMTADQHKLLGPVACQSKRE